MSYQYQVGRLFSDYMEIEDAVHSGIHFSLERYFQMCDQIRELIRTDEELLALHESRFSDGKPDVADDDHILVYDIMYCARSYDLYEGMDLPKKPKTAKARKETEFETQIAELKNELAEVQQKIREIEDKLDRTPDLQVSDLAVTHKKFDPGKVVDQKGTTLEVAFGDEIKKFKLPDAIARDFLKVDNPDIIANAKEQYPLIEEFKKLTKKADNLEWRIDFMSK